MVFSVYQRRTLSTSHRPMLSGVMAVQRLPRPQMQTSEFYVSHQMVMPEKIANHALNRELLDYFGKLVDKRVAKPENDMISKLVVEQVGLIRYMFTLAS